MHGKSLRQWHGRRHTIRRLWLRISFFLPLPLRVQSVFHDCALVVTRTPGGVSDGFSSLYNCVIGMVDDVPFTNPGPGSCSSSMCTEGCKLCENWSSMTVWQMKWPQEGIVNGFQRPCIYINSTVNDISCSLPSPDLSFKTLVSRRMQIPLRYEFSDCAWAEVATRRYRWQFSICIYLETGQIDLMCGLCLCQLRFSCVKVSICTK